MYVPVNRKLSFEELIGRELARELVKAVSNVEQLRHFEEILGHAEWYLYVTRMQLESVKVTEIN